MSQPSWHTYLHMALLCATQTSISWSLGMTTSSLMWRKTTSALANVVINKPMETLVH